MNFKHLISRHLLNIPGWRTNRKIVVIESDDWGSIRLSSKTAYNHLKSLGFQLDGNFYNRYDALESESDLQMLFETLNELKDKHGHPAVITVNTIMTNPDFEKIAESKFEEYYFEYFTDTYKKYPEHQRSFDLLKQGIDSGLMRPQFHGREHLNINRWMRALQSGRENVMLAFNHGMYDLSTSVRFTEDSFMETLDYIHEYELEAQKTALSEGLNIFEQLFGFRSTTFIAPCYKWSNKLNETLLMSGIRSFQGGWWQLEPVAGEVHRFKKRFHYTGQRNSLGQIYTVRNAFFEPAENPQFDWIGDVLQRAELAFKWKKPLIISTHRVNYIGFIDPSNRERNLLLFKKLISTLLKKFPDIEFMSSDRLSALMHDKT